MRSSALLLPFVLALLALACGDGRDPSAAPAVGWPVYGHDVGGSRHSPLTEITPE